MSSHQYTCWLLALIVFALSPLYCMLSSEATSNNITITVAWILNPLFQISPLLFNSWRHFMSKRASEQIFSYTMARTSWISMRWRWCPLCTRSTCLVDYQYYRASSQKQQSVVRHVAPIGTLSQPVFALTPKQ